ncbi:MAG: cytochrome c3 family protein [Acidobacteriota bacterium]
MRLKLVVVAIYGLLLFLPVGFSMRSLAFSDSDEQGQGKTQFTPIAFDTTGRRGLVLFNHKTHEALLNPDPNFPHKAPEGVACIGCHHSVKEETTRAQFQKCTACHKDEGNATNPDDREGYDLNSREAFHRLCISCHRASNLKASNARFRDVGFTKCAQCHDNQAEPMQLAAQPEVVPPPDEEPEAPPSLGRPVEIFTTPMDPPRGYAGGSRIDTPTQTSPDSIPSPDRWRIGLPEDPRFEQGKWYNPYRQNVLKGDYPIYKQQNFLVLTLESDTLAIFRRLPLPSDMSSARPDSAEFFGRGVNEFFRQNFTLGIEFFNGDAAFKPINWRFRFTPNFNINYFNTQENGIVNIDVRRQTNRTDSYTGFQELFTEFKIGDTTKLMPFLRGAGSDGGKSPYYDSTFIRTGIQQFISDFRGFIFNDFNLGARVFGQFANNRYNFNAAYFHLLEKDTNSELNTRVNLSEFRNQTVFIANLFRQDTKWKGYTTQFSFHYNNDRPSRHFDENDFLVRPGLFGSVREHGIKAYYLGWAGDGHIGLNNISHAFYQAFGHDSFNQIAGKRTSINAQQAAIELSRDRDWLRYKGSFFFASGDKEPFDDRATGFDAIVDIPEFAGGKFSYWNSQGIRLLGTGVGLKSGESLLPTLRSSKFEGQASFVNPGIFLYNLGIEAELTPKLRGIANINYLHFHHTESLKEILFQPNIRKSIGFDYGVGVLYRPFLTENWIIQGGFSSLIPGAGFNDIYTSNCTGQGCGQRSKTLFSSFIRLKFTY